VRNPEFKTPVPSKKKKRKKKKEKSHYLWSCGSVANGKETIW
jgi:hypothetical protein